MELRYSILDPTGNITALVESAVAAAQQPAAASAIMRRHPEVEQVGFLRADRGDGLPALRMAGGEFCGNASLCAAALLLRKSGETPDSFRLRVSGAERPVELRACGMTADGLEAEIRMPPALAVTESAFSFGGLRGALPLVRMQGISHLIVQPESAFFPLREKRTEAEKAVLALCAALGADCLGLMFLEGEGEACGLTPLVCVPGSGTLFWENSCLSGSAAAGMYLAAKRGAPVRLTLREPGGTLRVMSDPGSGETWLHGRARFVGEYRLPWAET